MLDIRPPREPFLYALGHATPFEITVPGGSMAERECIWLPSRREYENVADVSVLDLMPTLAIPLTDADGGRLPVGTRAVGPAMGETTPRVWTVRKLYDADAEWALVGVAE